MIYWYGKEKCRRISVVPYIAAGRILSSLVFSFACSSLGGTGCGCLVLFFFCNSTVMKSPNDSVPESSLLMLLVEQNCSLIKMRFSFSSIDQALMNFFWKTNSLGMDTLEVWFYRRKVICFSVIEKTTYNKCICSSFMSLQRVWNSFSHKNNEIAVGYGRGKETHFSFFPNVFLQRHIFTNTHT